MVRQVPQICLSYLKRAEACKLRAYRDSVGVWTIGVGHTGPEVVSGLVITQDVADKYLADDAATAARRLAAAVGSFAIAAMSEHQYSAMVSFAFNLGVGRYDDPKHRWRIWDVIKAQNWAAVPAQIMRFTHGVVNGVSTEIPGLINRRTAEVTLWNTPDGMPHAVTVNAAAAVALQAPPDALPSSTTRAMETPPVPTEKPLAAPSLAAKIGGAIGAVGLGAQQVLSIVQPHTDVEFLAKAATVLTVVVVAASAIGLWINHKQTQKAKL